MCVCWTIFQDWFKQRHSTLTYTNTVNLSNCTRDLISWILQRTQICDSGYLWDRQCSIDGSGIIFRFVKQSACKCSKSSNLQFPKSTLAHAGKAFHDDGYWVKVFCFVFVFWLFFEGRGRKQGDSVNSINKTEVFCLSVKVSTNNLEIENNDDHYIYDIMGLVFVLYIFGHFIQLQSIA